MAEEKKGFFSRLVAGLTKTRNAVVNGLDDIFNGPGDVDDDFYEELEETLITGDIGVRATDAILEDLRDKVKEPGACAGAAGAGGSAGQGQRTAHQAAFRVPQSPDRYDQGADGSRRKRL